MSPLCLRHCLFAYSRVPNNLENENNRVVGIYSIYIINEGGGEGDWNNLRRGSVWKSSTAYVTHNRHIMHTKGLRNLKNVPLFFYSEFFC